MKCYWVVCIKWKILTANPQWHCQSIFIDHILQWLFIKGGNSRCDMNMPFWTVHHHCLLIFNSERYVIDWQETAFAYFVWILRWILRVIGETEITKKVYKLAFKLTINRIHSCFIITSLFGACVQFCLKKTEAANLYSKSLNYIAWVWTIA